MVEITPLWDTSLVTTMKNTFQMCRSLKYADLSHLKLSSVTDVSYLFNLCIALIDAKLPELPSLNSCSNMFKNCTKLKGAVSYDANKTDVRMANPTTGYFTKKSATGIIHPTAAEPLKRQGIYNLQGVKMQGSLDQLPAGVYIVDGKKIVKK